MADITNCSKAIKGMTDNKSDFGMLQLQQLVWLMTQAARNNPSLFTTNVADNHLPIPRVFANYEEDVLKSISVLVDNSLD